MIFFLDENFPRPALADLEAAGHKASHTLDSFPPGTEDDKLFAHPQEQNAIFVTTDRDFFHTVPLAFARHHGAVVITLRKANRADLLRRLNDVFGVDWRKRFTRYGLARHRDTHSQSS